MAGVWLLSNWSCGVPCVTRGRRDRSVETREAVFCELHALFH